MGNLRSMLLPFLGQLRGRQSPRNRELYTHRLSFFLERWGHLEPAHLTRDHVNEWHDALKARGLAVATLAGYRQAVKSFLVYCCGPGHPANHLVTGSFTTKRKLLPPEPAVEAMTTLADKWLTGNKIYQVQYGAIFHLSKCSGARKGEIRAVRLSEVLYGLENPDLYGVCRVRSEGKTGDVILCLYGPAISAVRRWLSVRPTAARIDRLFVTTTAKRLGVDSAARFRPLSLSGLDRAFVALGRAAGVRPVRSHALRHRLGHLATKQFSPKVAAILLNHRDSDTAATAIAFYHHPDDHDVSLAVAALSAGTRIDDSLNKLFRVGGSGYD